MRNKLIARFVQWRIRCQLGVKPYEKFSWEGDVQEMLWLSPEAGTIAIVDIVAAMWACCLLIPAPWNIICAFFVIPWSALGLMFVYETSITWMVKITKEDFDL